MRNLLLIAPLFLLGGCYKTNLSNFAAKGSPGPEVKVWSHALIAGLIPLTEIDARGACGDRGVWAVSTRVNVWNALLASLTGGIYTPTTAKITCKG